MGFGEAGQKKQVYFVEFNEGRSIETIEIPVFQQLESIVGNKNFIAQRLSELKKTGSSVWVEVIYTGDEIFPDLSSWVNEQIADSNIEVLKLQNRQYLNEVLTQVDTADPLEEFNEMEVFDKLLEKNNIPDEQKTELKALYKEIIDSLHMQDMAL